MAFASSPSLPPMSVEYSSAVPVLLIFATKASEQLCPADPDARQVPPLLNVVRYAPGVVGKSLEKVAPAIYALPLASTAIPLPTSSGWSSGPPVTAPERNVEYTRADPAGLSFVTITSSP